MHPLFIAAIVSFIIAGASGTRLTFNTQLATSYMLDASNVGPDYSSQFVIRARRAETAGSRWDSLGVISLFVTVGLLVAGVVEVIR